MTRSLTWGNVADVRPSHPGVEDVEESALEALFQRGIRMRLIFAAMDAAKGNVSEAARQLRIGRATLHDKLAKYPRSS